MNIQRAIDHLVSKGLILPYELAPGSFPGGINSNFDEERWLRYTYNPLPGTSHLPEYNLVDTEASPKPTWQGIIEADALAELAETRGQRLVMLDQIATARIANLYHPDAAQNRNKEWQARLSGVDLANEDTQRVLIITAYRGFKIEIEAATSPEELTEIEVRVNAAGLGS